MSSTDLSKAIAEFSKSHNPNKLYSTSQLPKWVLDIPTPEGIVLAADVNTNKTLELEGDVSALKYVDLKKEGLDMYKNYI